jgi:mycothiol synthase
MTSGRLNFRPPGLEDAPAVFELVVARDIADLGAPDYTLDELYDDWQRGDFDVRADALVAESSDGRIVGYALVRHPGTVGVVAPDYEGRGIGTRLLNWIERRDRECGRERHRQGIAAGNERARALLLAAGYRPERGYWRLALALDDLTATCPPPLGVHLRPLDVDADAVAVHVLKELSFAANSDYRREPFEAFCEDHLRVHDLAPMLSCVAQLGDTKVGFLLARCWQEEQVGFVDLLGVHPDHRGHGLGTALLCNAFAAFVGAGLREAQLGVADDNPAALKLYQRCGMTPKFRIDAFERMAVSTPQG